MYDDIKVSVVLDIFWKLLEFEPDEHSDDAIHAQQQHAQEDSRVKAESMSGQASNIESPAKEAKLAHEVSIEKKAEGNNFSNNKNS